MSWTNGLEHIVREQEPLAKWCWSRIGGYARYFAEPTQLDELQTLVARCRSENVCVRLIGGGSNILVPDGGVDGVVIALTAPAFHAIQLSGDHIISGGGARLNHLVSTSIREGLGGLENLVGVPGTVGGALRTNAGDRGNHVGQWLRKATVLTRTGELFERDQDDLSFAYRQSSLDELAIITAEFELEREDPRELTRRMQKTWIVKQSTQPTGNQGTCLLFKDPIGVSARELMEQAELKNLTVGGVSLYERNLNFAIVWEGASCRDVKQLMDQVRRRVLDSAGVELEPTVDVW